MISDCNLSIVFSFLPLADLSRAACVSRNCKHLADRLWSDVNLKETFPTLSIIDKSVWEASLADQGGLAALGLIIDDSLIPTKRESMRVLNLMFRTLDIEENKEITLLTIPERLTLRKLQGLLPSHATEIPERILTEHLDIETPITRTVAMTNHCLKEAVTDKNPSILELLTLSLLTEKWTSKTLFMARDIRCAEKLSIGGLSYSTFLTSYKSSRHIGCFSFNPAGMVAALEVPDRSPIRSSKYNYALLGAAACAMALFVDFLLKIRYPRRHESI
jgi:hypothetical protein